MQMTIYDAVTVGRPVKLRVSEFRDGHGCGHHAAGGGLRPCVRGI